VGIGFRRRDSANEFNQRWLRTEPVLVMYVREKQVYNVRSTRLIPRSIRIRVTLNARRRTYAIPTDVRSITGDARAQFKQMATTVTQSPTGIGIGMLGSLCALVKINGNANRSIYGLTCQHVASLSADQPGLQPSAGATAWSEPVNATPQSLLGTAAFLTEFGTTDSVDECLDGALIQLTPGCDALQSEYWPPRWGSAVSDQLSMMSQWSKGAKLYSRNHTQGVAVSPPSLVPQVPVQYKGQTACITLAAEYELSGGVPTQPGDSGSAIVSNTNQLLAMHFAGVDGTPSGYAIPIYLLLADDAFGVSISLV
jgi:hypothetical protein